jgi:tetratricopeptide (TPR) repeat protein
MLPSALMRALLALLALAVLGAAPVAAADALAEARRLYNLGQYDTAAQYAGEALKVPATMEGARLVLGRIHLERFRQSADPLDLTEARNALKNVRAESLDARERGELAIGLGECLFLEDRFGTASESFERALGGSAALGPAAHERVLDWWATAIDRLAVSRPREAREGLYTRVVDRMERELSLDPSSAPAAYWLAAGLRGSGNLDRAWYAAIAGWVGAVLGRDHGAALRADLDRLMVQAIIPERAAKLQPADPRPAAEAMLAEWTALKAAWTR